MPGARTTIVVSAACATSTSACPTPTVSRTMTSAPATSSTRNACGTAHASPPRWPRVAIERMNTPGSVACSCIRKRSPRRAPPVNGDVGSTASTETFLSSRRIADTSTAHARALFKGIAPAYGTPAEILSFGQYGRWRRALVRAMGLRASDVVLDVATGTGLIARDITKQYGCRVVGVDQSIEMIGRAQGLADRVRADA